MIDFKKIKDHKITTILTNRYVLICLAFIIWMLFLDANSFLIHQDLNKEKNILEERKEDFEDKITTDKEKIQHLENEKGQETFARETYYMKKPDEDIFIIEEDSVETKDK